MTVLKKSDYSWEELIQKIKGSSFKGDFIMPYDELLQILGEPSFDGDGFKVDVEWIIETPHGIATVYNYKNGPSYQGHGTIDEIRGWHIGSRSVPATAYVLQMLDNV